MLLRYLYLQSKYIYYLFIVDILSLIALILLFSPFYFVLWNPWVVIGPLLAYTNTRIFYKMFEALP